MSRVIVVLHSKCKSVPRKFSYSSTDFGEIVKIQTQKGHFLSKFRGTWAFRDLVRKLMVQVH
jgi:hypothetical protein